MTLMPVAHMRSVPRPIKDTNLLLTKWSSIIKTMHAMCSSYFQQYYNEVRHRSPGSTYDPSSAENYKYQWVKLTQEGEGKESAIVLEEYFYDLSDRCDPSVSLDVILKTAEAMEGILKIGNKGSRYLIKAKHESLNYSWDLSYLQLTQLFGSLFQLLKDYTYCHSVMMHNVNSYWDIKRLEASLKQHISACVHCYKSEIHSPVTPRSLFDITLVSMFSNKYKAYKPRVNATEVSLVTDQIKHLISGNSEMVRRRYGCHEVVVNYSYMGHVPEMSLVNLRGKQENLVPHLDLLSLASFKPDYEKEMQDILSKVILKK